MLRGIAEGDVFLIRQRDRDGRIEERLRLIALPIGDVEALWESGVDGVADFRAGNFVLIVVGAGDVGEEGQVVNKITRRLLRRPSRGRECIRHRIP